VGNCKGLKNQDQKWVLHVGASRAVSSCSDKFTERVLLLAAASDAEASQEFCMSLSSSVTNFPIPGKQFLTFPFLSQWLGMTISIP
jgi:hypothetical protein